MIEIFDSTIKDILLDRLTALESHFDADVIFYYGVIHPTYQKLFRDFIEKIKDGEGEGETKSRLVMVLNTNGGSVETVEKMVEVIRFHYDEVYFIVPDYAMSAGTVLCMAGNKIFMDYSSSLGPIDPQVFNGKEWVPALGYLDQVERLLERANNGTISPAEVVILQSQDLATLSRYEQAKNLTITLLKRWLVQYKFSEWTVHDSTPGLVGQVVTDAEKETRAEEIARQLGDNKIWHSHGRTIGINTLKSLLRLKIEDFSEDKELRTTIRSYNDLLTEYIARNQLPLFMHSKNYF